MNPDIFQQVLAKIAEAEALGTAKTSAKEALDLADADVIRLSDELDEAHADADLKAQEFEDADAAFDAKWQEIIELANQAKAQ